MTSVLRTPTSGSGTALPVSFAGLGRSFGTGPDEQVVLRDISVDIRPGEVLAVLGPSGCGKSTMLRAAAGLDLPTAGTILIDGKPVLGDDDRCTVAGREPRLLPSQTLQANIAVGLPKSSSASHGKAKVAELLDLVGLAAFAKHLPRAVSRGLAQRTSLARAFAREPGVLLLDEPFGALDALTRLKMRELLLSLHRAAPATVLLVTDDVDEALQLADRVAVLGTEDGVPGATVTDVQNVPGGRPRDRASSELARMRGHLLALLGVGHR
ncbi:ABC transporter ATP-binding protein [Arthrobacter yangruifuii]|uniref:ABC transporter ATP-binding protein n=1 Tax=Arthrobacter yangruifuii TaxID=2606616 RepID=UPI0011B69EAA|nr:ABC transporter ATP-binding protein [Arthrobacter yangruifuii]